MRYRAALAVVLGLGVSVAPSGEPPYPFVDSPMYRRPDLPQPRESIDYPNDAIPLWLRALERPEADFRFRAAVTIAEAQRRGMKGLEVAVEPLRKQLDLPEQHPNVRLAAARALVALDARQLAPSFLAQARTGTTELREIVEPALARWGHEPARALWLERVNDPATQPRPLVLAMRALAQVGDSQAADRLRAIALAPRGAASTRVEAAKALAVLRPAGLEKDAGQLARDTSPLYLTERLVAAALLSKHTSPEAIALLQRLAQDKEPTVVALAVGRLLEIDEKLALGVLEALLKSRDAKLRSLGVEILRRQPSEKHLRLLADRLDDEHPEVRQEARRGLEGLAAKKELRPQVLAEGMRLLQSAQWQGLEQAAILLTHLDHKPAVNRLLELIWEARPEVFVTAAWGLRQLDVPDTLQPVLWYVTNESELLRGMRRLESRRDVNPDLIDHQLSQLHQLLGQRRYRPADKVLRRFVPRQGREIHMPEARSAAIWALGMLLEGKPDAGLAKQLAGRLDDVGSMPPEDDRVRYMSAITIGRMKAASELAMVRKYNVEGFFVHFACAWALNQITGEPIPKAKDAVHIDRNWFLKSVD